MALRGTRGERSAAGHGNNIGSAGERSTGIWGCDAKAAKMNEHIQDSSGGLRRFIIMVLVIFGMIVGAVALLALLGPDSGLLPFDYEGA